MQAADERRNTIGWTKRFRLRGRRRRRLFGVGIVLFAVGLLPLLGFMIWDSIAGDPANPGNPIGLGCWWVLVGGSGFLIALTGLSLDPPSEPEGDELVGHADRPH